MLEENEEEPILSPELAAELGIDSADIVLAGAKKKKRDRSGEEISEQVKTLAKQLSKKAQKRIAQITQRKEKEAKQSDFLSVIHEHEISEEHRQLLTSSRAINQTQTMKQLLSSLYKKQSAGIALTAEESQLLYNQPGEESAVDLAAPPALVAAPAAAVTVDSTLPSSNLDEPATVSLDDIFPTYSASDVASSDRNNKKRKKGKKGADTGDSEPSAPVNIAAAQTKAPLGERTEPVPVTASSVVSAMKGAPAAVSAQRGSGGGASVGSGLLAQLQLLKAGNLPVAHKAAAGRTSIANEAEAAVSEQAQSKAAYEVQETAAPVTAQGEVRKAVITAPSATVTGTSKSASATASGAPAGAVAAATVTKTAIQVFRSAEVQAARMELPVCAMEQEIVEAVNCADNDAIILCGETGSGKSTQVPQFLYEAGYGVGGLIGITQPRRVAVTSTAQRVSFEMTSGLPQPDADASKPTPGKAGKHGKKGKAAVGESDATDRQRRGQLVGYQIRFDSSTVGPDTRIKFMTDGILLKEVAQDLLLRKYRVVILDEAHERNMNTDVLLGMLSKVLPLRRAQAEVEQRKYDSLPAAERANYAAPLQPLKLIIMSATMRVNDFQNPVLFPVAIPPIIKVEARQYPVTTHFSKRTEVKNYLKETHKKVCQIHRKLPEGGVLVFLSGKQEILYMCHKLARSLNKKVKGSAAVGTEAAADADTAAAGPAPAESLTTVDAVGLGASAEELMELEEDAQLLHLQARAADGEEDGDTDKVASKSGKKRGAKGKRGGGASVRELLGQDEIDSDSEGEGQDGHSSDDGADSDDDDSDSGRPDSAPPVSAEEALFILDGDEDSHRRPAPAAATDMKSKIASTKKGFTTGDSVRDQLLKEALGISADASAEEEGAQENDAAGDTAAHTTAGADAEPAEEPEAPALRAWILPLYALMPAAQQNRVFLPPPPGHRLIVVATNVAETSITIPGIRYVVDSGRQKEKVLTSAAPPAEDEDVQTGGKRSFEGTKVIANDAVSAVAGAVGAGIAKYEVRWVAQAGAEQRKGRAGRTGPGHCYRLYSANFYHQYLQPYQPPEITVTPLEELILQMKALGIDHVERFPFPTPPPQAAVRNATALLTNLGAVSAPGAASDANKTTAGSQDLTAAIAMATMTAMKSKSALHQRQLQQLQELHRQQQLVRDLCPLTPLGHTLAKFPINPRFGKMLIMAHRASGMAGRSDGKDKYSLLAHALTLVATLAERSAFEGMADSLPGGASKKSKAADGAARKGADSDSSSDEGEDAVAACNEQLPEGSLFHHEDGDALARLRATGAYMHTLATSMHSAKSRHAKGAAGGRHNKAEAVSANDSPAVKALCGVHRLHAQTLLRVVELRDQLQDIGASVLLTSADSVKTESADAAASSAKALLNVPLQPPTPAQELALRQLIVSGFCDSIARRAPLGVVKTGPRRRRLTAYFSSHPALQDIPLYLHPGSNLYRKDPTATLPEFVTYGSLIRNQRGDCIYMTCVSTVSPGWLASVAADCPLLRWSAPMASPTPYYDAASDAVLCYVTPRFGVHSWELPAMRRPLYDCTGQDGGEGAGTSAIGTPLGFRKQDEAYRWFARLLLEGQVFASPGAAVSAQCVRELRGALGKTKLRDGSAAVVTQMKPVPKVSNLLRKLVTREVRSASALLQQLRGDTSFLCEEVLEFLLPEVRAEFRAAWVRVAQALVLAAKQK